jgi:hypothetical protein
LTVMLRHAWDGQPLQIATKNDPVRVCAAHFSLLGHCTLEDLHDNLKSTDVFNGFLNRFLFGCTLERKFCRLADLFPK